MFAEIASIAGPVLGGLMQSDSIDEASRAQAESSGQAIGEQQRQFDLTRKDLGPYRDAGSAAIQRLSHLLGIRGTRIPRGAQTLAQFEGRYDQPGADKFHPGGTWNASERANIDRAYAQYLAGLPQVFDDEGGDFGALNRKFTVGDFYDDPVTKLGLQFGLDEGRKGLTRMAAARGGLNSGATLKALERYGTDYVGTKAGESYNRFVNDQTNIYNRLAGVAGTGQAAANTTATLGANNAQTIGGIMTAAGNARGAASIAGGNVWGNAANQIGNYYGQQQTIDKILASRGGYGTPGYGGYGASPY